MDWIIVWIVLFVIAVIAEISTTQLVSIWFAGGALVSLILAICDVNYIIQIIVFVASSIILLAISRPIYKKLKAKDNSKTNYDALIGSEVIALSPCNLDTLGEAKVRDVTWSISVENDEQIEKGEKVIIKAIKGNKLIVTKKGN